MLHDRAVGAGWLERGKRRPGAMRGTRREHAAAHTSQMRRRINEHVLLRQQLLGQLDEQIPAIQLDQCTRRLQLSQSLRRGCTAGERVVPAAVGWQKCLEECRLRGGRDVAFGK